MTLVTHGDRKADLADTAPLSRDAMALLQQDVDRMAALFVDTVAGNRGLRPRAIDGMEGAVFRAAAGIAARLADGVMTPDAAFRTPLRSLG